MIHVVIVTFVGSHRELFARILKLLLLFGATGKIYQDIPRSTIGGTVASVVLLASGVLNLRC